MCDGLKFEPDPSCVRAGFRNRLYEGNDHTAETSTPRQCRALAGRWVLHPPHFALLFLSAEPANSWMSANRKLSGLDGGFSPVEVGISSGNQAPTRCAFVGTNPTDELITY